jgi:hypothetical protein
VPHRDLGDGGALPGGQRGEGDLGQDLVGFERGGVVGVEQLPCVDVARPPGRPGRDAPAEGDEGDGKLGHRVAERHCAADRPEISGGDAARVGEDVAQDGDPVEVAVEFQCPLCHRGTDPQDVAVPGDLVEGGDPGDVDEDLGTGQAEVE